MSSDYGPGSTTVLPVSDLHVEPLSDALKGRKIDIVVSGSIGAVESVRFVRALRRLGANIEAYLTAGGAQFVTPLALSWATASETRTAFSGEASHIASADACVIAPASANLIGKIANGITDTPASALVASHLGQGKPVLLLPNMHLSLAEAPAVSANLRRLSEFGVRLLKARTEEGKNKFPAPNTLADQVAHVINHAMGKTPAVLVTMGTTRGYIDDVRYVSNYSSGALGSAIVEELYRYGAVTDVVCGPCPIKPRAFSLLTEVETNEQMHAAAQAAVAERGAQAAIFAASVLDYVPKQRIPGKIRSNQNSLTIECEPTPKIIGTVTPTGPVKVGFKLEAALNMIRACEIADEYIRKYGLSAIIINDLAEVDSQHHRAWMFEAQDVTRSPGTPLRIDGKRPLAAQIARHVRERMT